MTISAQSSHADARDALHFAMMHRAKGLEFDAVVVVAPSSYFGKLDETVNQRKLVYVALTRAKRAAMLIHISWADGMSSDGLVVTLAFNVAWSSCPAHVDR